MKGYVPGPPLEDVAREVRREMETLARVLVRDALGIDQDRRDIDAVRSSHPPRADKPGPTRLDRQPGFFDGELEARP